MRWPEVGGDRAAGKQPTPDVAACGCVTKSRRRWAQSWGLSNNSGIARSWRRCAVAGSARKCDGNGPDGKLIPPPKPPKLRELPTRLKAKPERKFINAIRRIVAKAVACHPNSSARFEGFAKTAPVFRSGAIACFVPTARRRKSPHRLEYSWRPAAMRFILAATERQALESTRDLSS